LTFVEKAGKGQQRLLEGQKTKKTSKVH